MFIFNIEWVCICPEKDVHTQLLNTHTVIPVMYNMCPQKWSYMTGGLSLQVDIYIDLALITSQVYYHRYHCISIIPTSHGITFQAFYLFFNVGKEKKNVRLKFHLFFFYNRSSQSCTCIDRLSENKNVAFPKITPSSSYI